MAHQYVSIIVPTYRDWQRLALCVQALAEQTYPQHLYQVLLVNNDPNDPPPAGFTVPQNFRLLTEAKAGSYAARNAALQQVEGGIVGFTDSDCIPHKDWIQNAVTYLERNPACSRIAGHIAMISQGPVPTATDLYNSVFEFPQQMHASYLGTCVTANLITYRSLFDAVGLFDDTLLSMGDMQWGKAAHQKGFPVHFVENVMVQHPARSLPELVQKVKRVGGGEAGIKQGNLVQNFLGYVAANRPQLYIIRRVYRCGGVGLVAKLKILLLRHYLLHIRAAEKLRVQLGKQPARA